MPNSPNKSLHKPSRMTPLVLVVDDDLDNLIFVGCALDVLNVRSLIADNGKNALDLAMDKLPDLILLDIVMPEIDGIETARMLKKNPLTDHIPIIAVTGLTLPTHLAAIKNAGCNDYICKPFLINKLEAKISYYLNFSLI
ncbi:response regulator [Pleurocapsales cyanobacterium LEGE 10410]|nr:response regulator [Pleurocapsales cyanobacterium LEGE 10410]